MENTKFLEMVRGAIAIKQVQKKSLARKCRVTRPQFSEMIHGDRPMPKEVKYRLVAELGLESCMAKIADKEAI